MTRRVLVLSYYFPPMGGTGVQRVSNFVKYLPRHGWQPTVLTAHPRGYFLFDEPLARELEQAGTEVARTASADPTRLFGSKQQVSLPDEKRRSWLSALSQFFFVPDNKLGWAPSAFWQGRKLLRMRSYDAILSSAPPYTSHLLGAALSRTAGVPLITDFRDDWVGNPRHQYPTSFHRLLHERMEEWTLQVSSAVCATNERLAEVLRRRHSLPPERFRALPHAFDPDDFDASTTPANTDRMTLAYAGTFYDAQTPAPLLEAMASLSAEMRRSMEAVFVGLLPEREKERIRRLGLEDCTRHVGFVPHAEAMQYLQAADALWLTVGEKAGSETILLGKLPHYLAARKPILGLVPEGATRDVLEQCESSRVTWPDDVEAIRQVLETWIGAWQEDQLPTPGNAFAEPFSAETVTRRLVGQLESVTEQHD